MPRPSLSGLLRPGAVGSLLLALVLAAASWLQPVAANASSADPFYTYSGSVPLAQIAPGTALATRTAPYSLAGIPLPLQVTQLLYRTTDQLGRPTVNVTSVLKSPVRASVNRVVAYGSFYDSLNPEDGPSRGVTGSTNLGAIGVHAEAALVTPFLLQGDSVVVADTQGATADFASGPEYGTSTLDSIRAALHSPSTGIVPTAKVGLFGYSGGAIATNWAAALAPSYAPEINAQLVGAAEGGLLVDPAHNLHYIEGSTIWSGVLLMALVGATRGQGVPLTPYLNDYGVQVFNQVQDAAILSVLGRYPGLTWKQIAKPEYPTAEQIPAYVSTVNRLNLAQAPTPTIPLFIGQGANGILEGTAPSATYGAGDGVMIAGDVRSLARQYCAHGTRVQYREYDLTSHFLSVPLWAPEAIAWMSARFGTSPAPTSCGKIKAGTSLAPLPAP